MSSLQGISSYNVSAYSRFNVSEDVSDIKVFVREFRKRVIDSLKRENEGGETPFKSFAEKRLSVPDIAWLQDNTERFLQHTANQSLAEEHYLAECGFICSMIYTHDGEYIIVGHSSGLIQMRHGSTGTVLCTLRNIQFPPKPVHALEYSPSEPNVCYAACMDGAVYRIEIPHIDTSVTDPPAFCIRADPLLDSLNMQFYGGPGISSHTTPFVTQRFAALSLGVMADSSKMAVGYGDTSIKIYDMETQEAVLTYKVHKLRLQFIPKKLQRMHFGQVVALRTHAQNPNQFASGAWDNTLRIWDVRCQVGCVMTFVGVNICGDSIDLNRQQCIAGSWLPTEGLSVWDVTARKLLTFIRVQNRRLDVDGEYIYACRYWRSTAYNRKGKYAVIGGSGTNCLEVINLHNRYITCSYPTKGSILALTSHQERIAYGGTSSAFNIVSFHDPKYEKDKYDIGVEHDSDTRPTQGVITLFHDDISMLSSSDQAETETPATPLSIEHDGEDAMVSDDGKPCDKKPQDKKTSEKIPDDGKSRDKKPQDEKTPDKKPDSGKPRDKKPEDEKTPNKKPDDGKSRDKKPQDEKTPDKKPDDGKPRDKKPEDEKTPNKKPDDGKPRDKKPEDEKTPNKKPDDGKPRDKKPEDEKTPDKKPQDKKPIDKKPQ